jgi:HAD superfamily hydrolase (TIGR01509 family)
MYGLIFDVDGVIADTEGVNYEVTRDVLAEVFGLTGVRREDFAEGIGRGASAYVQAAARVHGRALTDEETTRATRLRQERFIARLHDPAHPLSAFPGVTELIAAAASDPDFAVAIATSSTREKSGAVLQAAGVAAFNLPCVTGDDVAAKKPAPDLFLEAACRLDVPPAHCVVFEDAPDGVAAARAAGMHCLAITNTVSRKDLAEADRVVDSLEGLSLDTLRELLITWGAAA